MSTKSPKIANWEPYVSKGPDKAEILKVRVMKFSYKEFRPERVCLAKRQIKRLISKILINPRKKTYFIQEINKLILYELGENKYE
ncbi:hypothetical protein LCGC14_2715520 [marine sediment metagenome]|uniref:Uncharacterized protein n=1 Tax=marine sediment metagenome TaxID=412755 RepID=A0A0F8ZBP2_9ZZZZ